MSANYEYSSPLELFLSRFPSPKKEANGYKVNCPAHNDKKPSLSVKEAEDGKLLLNCFVGCKYESIMRAVNLDPSDGFVKKATNTNYTPTYFHREKPQNSNSSKRAYRNLQEYTEFKGVREQVFIDAGWQNTTYHERPALKFVTLNGVRYRLIDGEKPSFINEKGFIGCWYKLDEAIKIGKKNNSPLILCNGEPSTVVAQYYKLPAFSFCGGEATTLKDQLIEDLKTLHKGTIIITPDNDEAGRNGAIKKQRQLKSQGFEVKVVDFGSNKPKGFDLADFVKLHKENSLAELLKLPDLVIPSEKNIAEPLDEKERKFDDLDFARLFAKAHNDLQYDEVSKTWRKWCGTHWEINTKLESLKELITETIRNTSPNTSITKNKVNSVMYLAQIICHQDFNSTKKHLINFVNGTLNYTSKNFYPHSPEDFLCDVLPYSFDLDASAFDYPNIKNYLLKGFPDKASIYSLMTHIGLALVSDRKMHNFLILIGEPGSGKSTALALMNLVCGTTLEEAFNFAGTSLFDRGLEGKRSRAIWNQKKLVSIDELPTEAFRSEELLKAMSAHSGVEMRFIGQNELVDNRWQPKLVFATNLKPKLVDMGGALNRRVIFLEMPKKLLEKEIDRNLLNSFLLELGAFAKACLEMVEATLKISSYPISNKMKKLFDEVKELSNPLKQWVDDNCVLEKNAWTSSADLHGAYKTYCEENKAFTLSSHTFTSNLINLLQSAVQTKKKDGARGLYGIRFRTKDDIDNLEIELETDLSCFVAIFDGKNNIMDILDTPQGCKNNTCPVATYNNNNKLVEDRTLWTAETEKNEIINKNSVAYTIESKEEKHSDSIKANVGICQDASITSIEAITNIAERDIQKEAASKGSTQEITDWNLLLKIINVATHNPNLQKAHFSLYLQCIGLTGFINQASDNGLLNKAQGVVSDLIALGYSTIKQKNRHQISE